MRRACEQVAGWNRTSRQADPLTVGVNVSPTQLQQADVVEGIAAILVESGLDPRCLVLEITETLLVDDHETTVGRLGALRALGVSVAIDDFGTGYSCLGYLDQLPVDILKLDRMFVAGIAQGRDAVARAIVQLAANLQLRVVAERVEEAAQADRLLELGCQLAQGYYFARPLPARELEPLLAPPVVLPLRPKPSNNEGTGATSEGELFRTILLEEIANLTHP